MAVKCGMGVMFIIYSSLSMEGPDKDREKNDVCIHDTCMSLCEFSFVITHLINGPKYVTQ